MPTVVIVPVDVATAAMATINEQIGIENAFPMNQDTFHNNTTAIIIILIGIIDYCSKSFLY